MNEILIFLFKLIASIKIGTGQKSSLSETIKENMEPTTFQKTVNKFLWLIGTSRNAILVIITGLIGFYLTINGESPFKLIGYIPPGLPSVQPPPLFGITKNNTTTTLIEMITNLGSGIIVIPLIALLENIAICKAFCNLPYLIKWQKN